MAVIMRVDVTDERVSVKWATDVSKEDMYDAVAVAAASIVHYARVGGATENDIEELGEAWWESVLLAASEAGYGPTAEA